MSSAAGRLRQRLREPRILIAPGVYDGLSALIAAEAGFEAVYVSGGAVARSMGTPDLGLATMSEVIGRLREVIDAVSVPVIADADTGYGSPLSVMRTVREFERLGVAALHLEDQVTPKRCGHYDGKELITPADMVQKLRAAVDARRDPELILIARTDAIAVEGLEGALDRARLYAQAGVDMLFVEATTSKEEIAEIARSIKVPLVINMFDGGRTPLLPPDEPEAMGYKLMIVPSDLQRAAIHGMILAARELRRSGNTQAVKSNLVSFSERERLVRLAHYQALEERYKVR